MKPEHLALITKDIARIVAEVRMLDDTNKQLKQNMCLELARLYNLLHATQEEVYWKEEAIANGCCDRKILRYLNRYYKQQIKRAEKSNDIEALEEWMNKQRYIKNVFQLNT